MVSLSVSMKIFEIWQYTNASDKFSIANQIVVLLIMTAFIGFQTYFTFFQMPKVVAMHEIYRRQRNRDCLSSIESEFKTRHKQLKSNLATTERSRNKLR